VITTSAKKCKLFLFCIYSIIGTSTISYKYCKLSDPVSPSSVPQCVLECSAWESDSAMLRVLNSAEGWSRGTFARQEFL